MVDAHCQSGGSWNLFSKHPFPASNGSVFSSKRGILACILLFVASKALGDAHLPPPATYKKSVPA
ncbi:hypothetical protein RKD52_001807 [Metabacillus sp. SLBN-84]